VDSDRQRTSGLGTCIRANRLMKAVANLVPSINKENDNEQDNIAIYANIKIHVSSLI
jgi:hypothetical protein